MTDAVVDQDRGSQLRSEDIERLPRRGRRKAAPAVRRTHTITLRLSPTELSLLRKRAAAAGMPPISYLRAAALSGLFSRNEN